MRQSTMASGKRTFERVMELIIIQMVIDMKEIGILIFKVELEPIIILMEIFTKVNGWMVSLTAKVTISTMEIKAFIRAIGKTVKNKGLAN